ncbi:unnamed protein product [Camellia sinensis]
MGQAWRKMARKAVSNTSSPHHFLPFHKQISTTIYPRELLKILNLGNPNPSSFSEWHAVSSWTWDAQDETCGICRLAFDGCCPDCKHPGDDCPLKYGVNATMRFIFIAS